MIYRNLMQTLSILPMVMLVSILTGCGGASSGDTTSTSNKPSPSSLAASSQTSEMVSSLAVSSTTSAITSSMPPLPTSTGVQSSAGSSYVRASRSSSSTASSLPDDITTPEKPEEIVDHPPSEPTELRLVAVSIGDVAIQWTAATDDKGVTNYEIRRNNVYVGSSPATKTSFVDSGLTSNTTYIYTVRAVDTIGNRSGFSSPLNIKTQPSPSSSSSSSSNTSNSSKSSNSNSSISSRNSSSSAISVTSSSSATLAVEWRIPDKRENGDYLELYEIGGYELRHMPFGSSTYSNTIITSATTNRFIIPASTLKDTYEVAAFDVNGLYSRFIKLTPH